MPTWTALNDDPSTGDDIPTALLELEGRTLDLTFKEFELLKFLAQHPGRVFTRQQLLQEVWGYDYFGGTRTVDVHVGRLRKALNIEDDSATRRGRATVWTFAGVPQAINTGDGMALAYRAGAPLEDMEFYQFHPTGIVGIGILLSEAARGEGGYLLNGEGRRFMESYAPKLMELAPRDMVSRAMYQEIRAGRGIDGKDYVHLDVRHLGRKVIEEKLPDITDFARVYQGVEPISEPVPVQPTAHYAMGGVPTNLETEVIASPSGDVVPGLYAAGEVACVSVHGANRLGTNSLVDLLVFGKRAGKRMAAACAATAAPKRVARAEDAARSELLDLSTRPDGVRPAEIRRALASLMMEKVGVYRDEVLLASAVAEIRALKGEYQKVRVEDSGSVFNTDLLEARELGYLLDASEATAVSALARRESRGAHSREDFPERDDAKFLAHTMVWRGVEQAPATRIEYKPVTITTFEPKPRVY